MITRSGRTEPGETTAGRVAPIIIGAAIAVTIGAGATRTIPVLLGAEITSWLFLAAAMVGLAARLRNTRHPLVAVSGVEWGGAILLAGGAVATLANGAPAFPGLLRMIQHVTIIVAVASLPATWSAIRLVMTGLVVGIGLQVAVGLGEIVMGRTFFYSTWKPIEAATWNGFLRIGSTAADPNYFALGLVGTIALVAIIHRIWPRVPWQVAVMGAGAWLLLLSMTFSRAGYIVAGLVAATAVLGGLLERAAVMRLTGRRPQLTIDPRRLAAIGAVLIVVMVGAVVTGWAASFATRLATLGGGPDASLSVRGAAQYAALLVFVDHPLTGVGFDRFVRVGPEYLVIVSPYRYEEINALNSFLLVGSEGGVLALVGLVLATIWSIVQSARLWGRLRTDQRASIPVAAVALGLVGVAAMSLTLDGIHAPLQWALFGLAALCWRWDGGRGQGAP